MKNVRKIVKRTHKDGTCSYVVKVRVFWFFWCTDSWDYWYGPGMCRVNAVFGSLEEARKYIEEVEASEKKADGEKIVKRETIR